MLYKQLKVETKTQFSISLITTAALLYFMDIKKLKIKRINFRSSGPDHDSRHIRYISLQTSGSSTCGRSHPCSNPRLLSPLTTEKIIKKMLLFFKLQNFRRLICNDLTY